MANLMPRSIFVAGERHPVVIFFTSSRAKFAQANLVFNRVGLRLAFRAHDSEPYHEDYGGSKEDLLTEAIAQIQRRGGASGSFFFIEDTSIRIEALSTDTDQPGLGAKEWFTRTTFDDLDGLLKEAGDRRASVKSCIALSLPGLKRPLFFYGQTQGEVARRPAVFEPNPFYPWLSPDNFSAWLVPDGASRTLSEMSLEESLKYDFRIHSLAGLTDRLEEYTLALNATPPTYSRRYRVDKPQPTLFPVNLPIILALGPTCAGKTTFGSYVQQNLGWQFIDASSIVRVMREERQREKEDIADFAHGLLEREGADVVARYISSKFINRSDNVGTVISGFRAIEEVEFFREEYPNILVISIETPERVRYDRYLRRGTRTKLHTFDAFLKHDERQHSLGLLRVAADLADIRLANVHSELVYFQQIGHVLGQFSGNVPGLTRVTARMNPERSQLYRCLAVLRDAGRPLTTQEIQHHFPDGPSVRYNNANKMLKRYPELAHRQESPDSNVKYQITPRGLAFLGAIDRLKREPD